MNPLLIDTFVSFAGRLLAKAHNRLTCLVIPFLCLAAATTFAQAAAPLAVPVEGKSFEAALLALDGREQLTFRADGKPRTMPLADLVRWGTCREPLRGPIVLLSDGGLLAADVTGADKETLTVESDLFTTLKLPLDALAGVVFHLPSARHDRDLLMDRVAQASGDADRLVLDNGDELNGQIEAIGEDAVRLRAAAREVKIETQRIAALVFNPSLRRKDHRQGLRTWAGFADGSRLLATHVLASDTAIKLTTAGQTWQAPPQKLVFLQPLSDRVVYLSDLKAEGYHQVPFLELSWPYHNDRSVTGGLLRCGGRLYLKGLGVHSAARLTYLLDQPYRRFQSELGIDDATAGGGSVRFRVFLDGREKFTSETIRGGQPPVAVSLELTGVKRLDLVVDYADAADVLDHADWLDARLVPRN